MYFPIVPSKVPGLILKQPELAPLHPFPSTVARRPTYVDASTVPFLYAFLWGIFSEKTGGREMNKDAHFTQVPLQGLAMSHGQ